MHGNYAPFFVHVQYAHVWISCNMHQSKFCATSTRPLFMGNTHHPLFMCNAYLSEFRAIRTNLNSAQYAHILYSWAIRIILCSCAIYINRNTVQYTPSWIHMQYASIWILCNVNMSFIHGQYAPSFVRAICTNLNSCVIHINLNYMQYSHILC